MTEDWKKGSEWRKWDLHVHTPASFLNAQFGTDWDKYVVKLFRTLVEKNVAAVGITDYFTIDGYKKIKEEYLSSTTRLEALFTKDEIAKINQILVLPNIEFRSDVFVGEQSVNFHVLFSESVSLKEIEEGFLYDIDFLDQGEPQGSTKTSKLKTANLIELGQRLQQEHAKFKEYSAIHVGAMNAVVSQRQVAEILYNKLSVFGGKYVSVVVSDEDLSKLGWDSRDHLSRKVLIQQSDFLFSSNENTRNWALGRPPYKEGEKSFRKEFRTLKPCIHGSDAHSFFFIGHPCSKRGVAAHDCSMHGADCLLRHCWIKADLTFEGLRQVLYEPEDRIIIQPNDPTPLRSSQTISEFDIKTSNLEPELRFKEASLVLNSGLVAVTGGKGSGKTALVDLIANHYEDRAFCKDPNSFVRRLAESKHTTELVTTLKLQGGQDHSKDIMHPSRMDGSSIVYVAQGELEKHVEDPNHLEAHINSLIFESDELRDSELMFDYMNINSETLEIEGQIETINEVIFKLEEETTQKVEEDLTKEGKRLETEITDIRSKILETSKGLSEAKIKESEEQQRQLTTLRDKKAELIELGLALKNKLNFMLEELPSINQDIEKINTLSVKLGFVEQFKTVQYPDSERMKGFIASVRATTRQTISAIEKFQKQLDEKERGIKQHTQSLDKKKELERRIKQNQELLAAHAVKKKQIGDELTKRTALFRDLLSKRVEQRDKYLLIIAKFSENKNEVLKDLEFTSSLVFDKGRFVETMLELVDQRKITLKGATDADSEIAFFINALEELANEPTNDRIEHIVTKSVSDLLTKIVPNQKRAETTSRQTVYNAIFGDYLSVLPTVKYNRIKLSKLSIGQKASVLLKIYLAQGENPIVIDSHDDHLDNEFIMEELVKALRQAKRFRQVIIVSNNGNVVVNSDAEQVIIAQRDNQGEISYVAGSIENPALRPKLLKVLEGGELAFSKRQQKYRIVP